MMRIIAIGLLFALVSAKMAAEPTLLTSRLTQGALQEKEVWVFSWNTDSWTMQLERSYVTNHKYASLVHENGELVRKSHSHEECYYHGIAAEDASVKVAVSLCDNRVRGMLLHNGKRHSIDIHSHAKDKNVRLFAVHDCESISSVETCALHHNNVPEWSAVHAHAISQHTEKTTCSVSPETASAVHDADILPSQNAHRHMEPEYFVPVKYVEMMLVNDNARYNSFSSAAETEAHTLQIVNSANLLYRDANLEPEIRLVVVGQITVTDSDPWTDPGTCSGNPSETDTTSLLSNFMSYTETTPVTSSVSFDSAYLFTDLDLCGGTVGFAYLGTICKAGVSGGIVQSTLSNAGLASTLVHELGHNFDLVHDGEEDECSSTGFIMAASGNLESNAPDTFSSCSKTAFNLFMQRRGTSTICLNNFPFEMFDDDVVCGDGIVGAGEQCDCGASDCSTRDPCCDGSTCQLVSGAECSNADACCDSCAIVPAHEALTCRSAFDSQCDTAETCNGESSICPPNVYEPSGAACTMDFNASVSGVCHRGTCVSHDAQCFQAHEDATGGCSSVNCGGSLSCDVGGSCTSISAFFGEGTACLVSPGVDGVCVNQQCVAEADAAFTWETSCEFNCSSGLSQEVVCRDRTGAIVPDADCSILGTKPDARNCPQLAPQFCSASVTVPSGNLTVGDVATVEWNTTSGSEVYVLLYSEHFVWPEYVLIAGDAIGSANYTVPEAVKAGDHYFQLRSSKTVNETLSGDTFTIGDTCTVVDCGAATCTDGICSNAETEFVYPTTVAYFNITVPFSGIPTNSFDLDGDDKRFAELVRQELAYELSYNVSLIYSDASSISNFTGTNITMRVVVQSTTMSRESLDQFVSDLREAAESPTSIFSRSAATGSLAVDAEFSFTSSVGKEKEQSIIDQIKDWIVDNPYISAGVGAVLAIAVLVFVRRRCSVAPKDFDEPQARDPDVHHKRKGDKRKGDKRKGDKRDGDRRKGEKKKGDKRKKSKTPI